jgi:hypothetical protein
MIDKIDIEKVVLAMFLDKTYKNDGITYVVKSTRFDLITNRFYALASAEGQKDVEFVITRQFFGTHYDALASTPGGQPFIAEEGQEENINHLTKVLKGKTGKGAGAKIQCGILSTEIGKKGKEISGPKKAAEDMKRLIQEVRIMNPDININKNFVKKLINEKYFHIFNGLMNSSEVWRYNHYLYQLDTMKKADFRRIDDANIKVDLSSIAGFAPKNASDVFSPLLVTPNLNIELNAFGETFEELVELPNYGKMVQEFENLCNKLYIATGYSEETVVNNMIVQLLLMGHYIDLDDIARGKVAEKVNRETIAAAKKAVVNSMRSDWKPSTPTKPTTPPVAPVAEAPELSTPEVSDAPAANEASPKKGKK